MGQTYLIQHSAGSGKSNSITWAAYQLIEAYPASASTPGAKGLDQPLFDSVIVVTDRRLLDKQLRENIKDFSEVKNIIAPATKSSELKAALENGKKIIITTIQKFPVIVDPHNRELAFEKMLKEVMLMRRKDELELYKLFANDAAFKASWQQSLERTVNQPPSANL